MKLMEESHHLMLRGVSLRLIHMSCKENFVLFKNSSMECLIFLFFDIFFFGRATFSLYLT